MNKSVLALAVLGAFAGAASAQSSVTIYGSIDLAVTKSNGGTAGNNGGQAGSATQPTAPVNVAAGQRNTGKAWTLQQGNAARLGFLGNEDLGGGLSAQFQLEHRFFPDTGAAANPAAFWQGRSYVQLSSTTFGKVYLGREYGPEFFVAVKIDPFTWDGVGQLGTDMYAGFRDPNPLLVANTAASPALVSTSNNARTPNTIGYKTPNLSGLTGQLAVALGEGQVGRDTALNVEYAAGPIYGGFAYNKVTGSGVLTAGDGNSKNGDSLLSLGFKYDLGVVAPILYYARATVAPANNPNGTGEAKNTYAAIGARAPLGNGVVKVAYARFAYDGNYKSVSAANPAGARQDFTKFALGYDYSLSKRTNVYGDFALTRKDLATNNNIYSFGIKHTF